ncbi:MAG: hypothetical protein AAF841_02815 [Pseudomonadota bacterium]
MGEIALCGVLAFIGVLIHQMRTSEPRAMTRARALDTADVAFLPAEEERG